MGLEFEGLYNRPEHIVDHFKNLLDANASFLGFNFVGSYDEKLTPKYPAVVISHGPTRKEIIGTNKYNVYLTCMFWVYHGDATQSHAQRTREDLLLVTGLIDLLESDTSLGGHIINGFVVDETPGVTQSRTSKSDIIVGTRLDWAGMSQQLMRLI